MSTEILLKSNLLKALSVTAVLAVVGCSNDSSNEAASNWSVDSTQSILTFSSTKNGDITEEHSFKNFSGELDAKGNFTLTVDLTSVTTGIPIRDERLQKHVFNTQQQPQATITGHINPELLNTLNNKAHTVAATLELAGQQTDVKATVMISAVNDTGLKVTTQSPVVLSVEELGVKAGVDKLQEIAGLNSIDYQVPVNFSLTFTQ